MHRKITIKINEMGKISFQFDELSVLSKTPFVLSPKMKADNSVYAQKLLCYIQ